MCCPPTGPPGSALLAPSRSACWRAPAGLHPAVRALALPPLLQLVAFQQDPALKKWAAHCLTQLSSLPSTLPSASQAGPSSSGSALGGGAAIGQGEAALTAEAQRQLVAMWGDAR